MSKQKEALRLEDSFWRGLAEDIAQLIQTPYIPTAMRVPLNQLQAQVQRRIQGERDLPKDSDLVATHSMLLTDIIKALNRELSGDHATVYDSEGQVVGIRHLDTAPLQRLLFLHGQSILPDVQQDLMIRGLRMAIYQRMYYYVTVLCPHEQSEQYHAIWGGGLLERLTLGDGRMQITGYQMTVFCESNPQLNLYWLLTNKGLPDRVAAQKRFKEEVTPLRERAEVAQRVLEAQGVPFGDLGRTAPLQLEADKHLTIAYQMQETLKVLVQRPNTLFFAQTPEA